MRFLDRLKELHPLAKKKLAEAQARYKATFDRSVREKNKELQTGSWVYVRKEVNATGSNPKLDAQVDGPYRVLETDGRTFQIQQGEQKVRISSDSITPAPAPLVQVLPKTFITPKSSPVTSSDYSSANEEDTKPGTLNAKPSMWWKGFSVYAKGRTVNSDTVSAGMGMEGMMTRGNLWNI
jgi:hypothetical protein